MIAPERDVVRVEELAGPRGGRTLVLHLSCGCFLTRSSKAPPPKRARCTPCAVMRDRPDLAMVVLNRRELELVCRLVDAYRAAVHERVQHAGVVVDPRTEAPLVDGLLLGLERAKSQWAQRGGDL